MSPSNVQASTTDGTVCFGHLFAVTRSADCPFTPATDNRAVVGSAAGRPHRLPLGASHHHGWVDGNPHAGSWRPSPSAPPPCASRERCPTVSLTTKWSSLYRKAHAGPERRRMQCCSAAGAAAAGGGAIVFLKDGGSRCGARHQTPSHPARAPRAARSRTGSRPNGTLHPVDDGPRLEDTQIENMSRGDCIDRLLTIQGDRDLTKGQCIGPAAPCCPRTGRFRFAVLPAFPAAGCCQNASA